MDTSPSQDQDNTKSNQPAEQCVVASLSLKGVSGWLIYWMMQLGTFALYGLLFTFIGLAVLASGEAEGSFLAFLIETVIFLPIISGLAIASLILIGLQKKLGKIVTLITFGAVTLYSIIASITGMTAQYCSTSYNYGSSFYYNYEPITTCTGIPASGIIMLIGAIVISIVAAGLASLYFLKSKRVALTLAK